LTYSDNYWNPQNKTSKKRLGKYSVNSKELKTKPFGKIKLGTKFFGK
jgi:hypothetical protein